MTARRTRTRPRWLTDTRGAVFAEAVIMLPFFILVWGCILYVHTAYSRKITLAAQTKACAFQYADNGCTSTPPGCAGMQFSTDPNGIDAIPGSSGSAYQDFRSNSIVSTVFNVVLGKDGFVEGHGSLTRPRVIGGGNAALASRQVFACNEVPRTAGDVMLSLFHSLTPF